MSELGLPELTYLRLKRVFHAKRPAIPETGDDAPFAKGRDPRLLANVVGNVAGERGWTETLAKATVLDRWDELVGEDIAEHTTVSMVGNDLIVQCTSTAWATNLKLMRSRLLGMIRDAVPHAPIESIHFRGPDAPSWRHGPRTIPGRGPRDTYG